MNNTLKNIDERRLPWPGGIKKEYEELDIPQTIFNEEIFKNKPMDLYKYFIEKIAEFKFGFGEFLKEKEIISRTPYLIYLYAFLILFTFGIGVGLIRNNFKKSVKDEAVTKQLLIVADNNQNVIKENNIQEIKKKSSKESNSNAGKFISKNSFKVKEITKSSPSLEEIKTLINTWLQIKGNYLAGKSEINLSKIVNKGLIDRTIEERQNDIKKGIYKEINSQIKNIDLESQTSSRIVVLVELNYLEIIKKKSGEFVSETLLTPLKVKYIFGFSNKSWKLVDFVSGL